MTKNCMERMQENHSEYKMAMFRMKQKLPYELKVKCAYQRAWEFYNREDCFVSVGGLDSITLLIFLREYCGIHIPAVSVSSLEDSSIQKIHKQLGVKALKPKKAKCK